MSFLMGELEALGVSLAVAGMRSAERNSIERLHASMAAFARSGDVSSYTAANGAGPGTQAAAI